MFRPRHDESRPVPLRRIVPSVITSLAVCAGLAALHFSLDQQWHKALVSIVVAAILDALDGRAARLLRATSRFGAVLDSLSDFLAFGIAPAFLLYVWALKGADFGLPAVMTYVLCAALRLARFTSAPPSPKPTPAATKFFTGLPSPAAAGIVLIPAMLANSDVLPKWLAEDPARPEPLVLPSALIVLHTLLVAFLMISRVPMFSFKKIRISRPLVSYVLALLALAVWAMIKDTWLTVAAMAAAYLLTLPFSVISWRRLAATTPELIEPGPPGDEVDWPEPGADPGPRGAA